MNSPKTEHKPIAHAHSHPVAEHVSQPTPSSTQPVADMPGAAALIESLNSLTRKLDSFPGALAEILANPDNPSTVNTAAGANTATISGTAPSSTSAGSPSLPAVSVSDAPEAVNLQSSAAKVSSLVDQVSQSRASWTRQTSALQDALDAIMTFLEREASVEEPKFDLSNIMHRLRNLEEQQRNLQTQFNTSR